MTFENRQHHVVWKDDCPITCFEQAKAADGFAVSIGGDVRQIVTGYCKPCRCYVPYFYDTRSAFSITCKIRDIVKGVI